MAIDKETSFNVDSSQNNMSNLHSIRSARMRRQEDIMNIQEGAGNDYIQMLEKQIKALEKIDNLRKTDNKRITEAKKLLQEQMEFQLKKDNDYEKYLKNLQEVFKITQQLSDTQYNAELTEARAIKNKQQQKKAVEKAEKEEIARQREYNFLLKQANSMIETNKEANKSQLEAFSQSIHNIKSEIKDLAVIKGIGDITQGLFDKNGTTSMNNVYRNTSAQLGISNSEFNRFKNELTGQLAKSDNFFNFGWKDTAEYLNRLGELNITSQDMAEQQYLAVIQGTKYLGLQTDTQAKILKLSRDTGRMDLLQQTNETMVQIMNAQLGISKEQLNEFAKNAVEIADIATFLGGDGSAAMKQLETIQAAVTNEYGKATSDAATNILRDIIANPSNNRYLSSGFFGGEYNNILGDIQSNNYDAAIKRIISSVQTSNSLKVARGNTFAMEALGVDSNIMAIGNANGSIENVNRNMDSINSASSEIAETIKKFNQDWSDKIINAGSNILSLLPFSQVLSLQNVYYALAITELVSKLPKSMITILGYLKSLVFSSNRVAPALDGTNPKGLIGTFQHNLAPLGAIAAGVASIAMFVGDAKKGSSMSDEWGTGKVAATIGGTLGGTDSNTFIRSIKNAGKYALAGAAIGSLFGGVGALPGYVLGGIIGLVAGGVTGAVGGENIAKGIDNLFGKRKDVGVGAAPSAPSPHYSPGMGAADNNGGYPWRITSEFGNRTLPNGDNNFHNGVDWGIAEGTPVGAPVSGVVSSATIDNRNTYPSGPIGAGSGVYLQGDDGMMYQFWHLSQVGVQKGQRVKAGESIGLSGNTGYSTGAHLHFGTKKNGSWVNPLGYVTAGLFSASGGQYTDNKVDLEMAMNETKDGGKLLEKVISADTLSNQASSVSYGRGAGNDEIVAAVNNGFMGLNDKLEDLSSRQNNQEEVLRQLTSGRTSAITGY